jgi:YD repeat-containing protein
MECLDIVRVKNAAIEQVQADAWAHAFAYFAAGVLFSITVKALVDYLWKPL